MITLTTDFGVTDPFVGVMKGVIASRAPGAQVIDVTHGIPPQGVTAGALVLRYAVPYFPAGTIHVAVVDPGVGSVRRALCVETRTGFLVGPDNGLLSLAAEAAGIERIVELADDRFFLTPRSATFHGRDVFAPVAAALAAGTPCEELGPACDDLARLHLREPTREGGTVRGEVLYVDHFGNLVTNVAPESFPPGDVRVTIGGTAVGPVRITYADAAPNAPLALVNSFGLLEIAVRNGSARERLGQGPGAAVVLRST